MSESQSDIEYLNSVLIRIRKWSKYRENKQYQLISELSDAAMVRREWHMSLRLKTSVAYKITSMKRVKRLKVKPVTLYTFVT